MAKLDVIRGCHVFQKLSTGQLQRIASISREESYEAGQTIFREGEQARSLYILEEGKIILEATITPITAHHPSLQATIDVIIKGESFAWSAVVGARILTLSARTIDRCKVIAIDGAKLIELMDSDPAMGYEVMTRLSEVIASRLIRTRQTLMSERGLALLSQAYSY